MAIEILLDPKWEWGSVKIDGQTHKLITLHHPRYGEIVCIVPDAVVKQMIEGLSKLGSPK